QSVISEALPYSGTYPEAIGKLGSTYNLRGETLAQVIVSPIQYDYDNKVAIVGGKVSYTLTFIEGGALISEEPQKAKSPTVYANSYISQFLKNSLVTNINTVGDVDLDDAEGFEGTIGYIIVTKDEYLSPVKNFARWKNILGYTTHIISKPEWNSPSEVLSAIRECRLSNDNVRYLMIFGDHIAVPPFISPLNSYLHSSDYFFGTLPGVDSVPGIYIGRAPVSSVKETDDVVYKLVRAEMCPTLDENFYKKAAHCAKFDVPKYLNNMEDRRFVLTSEEIRDYVKTKGIIADRFYAANDTVNPQFYNNGTYSFGQAIPADLQKPTFAWETSTNDINQKLNEGCFYALYRGHGLPNGWEGVGYYTDSLIGLNNYEAYPLVFSITCRSGMYSMANCFASQFLKMREAGAIAVIAATQVSFSGLNDAFIEGMFDAIWPEPGIFPRFNDTNIGVPKKAHTPTYRLGQIFEQGLQRMSEQYGEYKSITTQYQYEVFHLFGDPSMYFFTESPKCFSNVEIERSENGIWVSTNGELASISFYNPNTGSAYRYENDRIFLPTDDAENTIVCLTGHNRQTYLDGIAISSAENAVLMPAIQRCSWSDNSTASVKIHPGDASREITVTISDLTGRYTYSTTISGAMNVSEVELPACEAKGVYVISLSADGVILDTKKIIK
ncbi:MAG: T9SS type A sorting domain-containing protein, partial [Muribaculaceae bacterium]|nr:T9SS type A sorting domain-containing protein [Muribaculaceae bacterium]